MPYWIRHFEFRNFDFEFVICNPKQPRLPIFFFKSDIIWKLLSAILDPTSYILDFYFGFIISDPENFHLSNCIQFKRLQKLSVILDPPSGILKFSFYIIVGPLCELPGSAFFLLRSGAMRKSSVLSLSIHSVTSLVSASDQEGDTL